MLLIFTSGSEIKDLKIYLRRKKWGYLRTWTQTIYLARVHWEKHCGSVRRLTADVLQSRVYRLSHKVNTYKQKKWYEVYKNYFFNLYELGFKLTVFVDLSQSLMVKNGVLSTTFCSNNFSENLLLASMDVTRVVVLGKGGSLGLQHPITYKKKHQALLKPFIKSSGHFIK